VWRALTDVRFVKQEHDFSYSAALWIAEERQVTMIRIAAIQLQRLAVETLRQLDVADTVHVLEVRELADGMWMVGFEDRAPYTRFPGFEIGIQQDWSPEQATRELRLELRNKLWICPLCQRRALIRRIVDREVFRVECEHCGRFEIESSFLDYLRTSYEAYDQTVMPELSRLAAYVGRTSGMPLLSVESWRERHPD
jgi:hypothetical protein